jgi:capsular polysaccharide biosynthesis protein
VQNEESVIRALEEVGFECYEPGRLTYEEQVQMFADADVIVGAHGKAFMNIIHSRSAGLLEMFPDRGVTEHYFLAARELGLSYEYFVGEPVYGTNNLRPRDNDFIVDDQLLQSRVLSLIDDVENN